MNAKYARYASAVPSIRYSRNLWDIGPPGFSGPEITDWALRMQLKAQVEETSPHGEVLLGDCLQSLEHVLWAKESLDDIADLALGIDEDDRRKGILLELEDIEKVLRFR